jgi:hypothetical protein
LIPVVICVLDWDSLSFYVFLGFDFQENGQWLI